MDSSFAAWSEKYWLTSSAPETPGMAFLSSVHGVSKRMRAKDSKRNDAVARGAHAPSRVVLRALAQHRKGAPSANRLVSWMALAADRRGRRSAHARARV